MTATDHEAQATSRRRQKLLAGGAILACLAAGLVLTTPATAKPSPLQRDLDALVAAGAPGSILLVRDGHRKDTLTSGLAEIATGTRMHARDRYRIASLTKTFTATVVLQLVGEGRLGLDDNVEQWIPGLLPDGDEITIRQLLNHTSGLYDYERDPEILAPYLGGDLAYYWDPRRVIEIAVARGPVYPPGETTVSTYSNTNYAVLGQIVRAVTGNTIETETENRIFRPLHLRSTTFPVSSTIIEGRHAHGYFVLEPPALFDITSFSPSLAGAGGAIVSNVRDVARFYRALLEGRLLTPSLLAAMQTTLPDATGDLGQRYGFGIEQYETSCGTAWGHSGAFPGYWTYSINSGDGERQMVLMVNIDPTAAPERARELFEQLLFRAYCTRL
jgi:D-alanyl-D-alanine carboxypeptidase